MRNSYIFIVLAGVFLITTTAYLLNKPPEEQAAPSENIPDYSLWIKNFEIVNYQNDKLINKIVADELKVQQRRFIIFNIRPFEEMVLTNATLIVSIHKDKPSNVNVFDGLIRLLPSEEKSLFNNSFLKAKIGLITRSIIKNLRVYILQDDKLAVSAAAERALPDLKNDRIEMEYGGVEDKNSGAVLAANRFIWDNKKRLFEVPEDYVLRIAAGQRIGRKARLDLDFNLYH